MELTLGHRHLRRIVAGLKGGWRLVELHSDGIGPEGLVLRHTVRSLDVLVSHFEYSGFCWLHVSVGHRVVGQQITLPAWCDMVFVKNAIIGEEIEAYQIAPPKSRWYSLTDVLHWWACLTEPDGLLPHFEQRALEEGFGVPSI